MDIHKYFDNYEISINPETNLVEITHNKDTEWLKDYEGKYIELDNETKKYLVNHYNKFKKID
jgi:hypothetical protein